MSQILHVLIDEVNYEKRPWSTYRDDGLAVTTPAEPVDERAVVFKIRTTRHADE